MEATTGPVAVQEGREGPAAAHPCFRPEHEALRQTVRELVARHLRPHARAWEEARAFPKEVFRLLGEHGLLGLRVPESLGGAGLDWFATLAFVEELHRCGSGGLAMAVMVHTDMALPPLVRWGTPDQHRRFVEPAVRGERVLAIAMTEPWAGSDLAGIRTTARRVDGGWVLDGTKTFITNGAIADVVLVAARTDPKAGRKGISLFLVERGTPGFRTARLIDKVGMHSSDTGELVFEGCHVPDANLLGEPGRGFYHLMWELLGERLVIAAGVVAMAQEALELAVAHVQSRHAFGRPLARFQALQHRLADMAARLEAARQLVYWAAWRMQSGLDAVQAVMMAKLVATRTAFEMADEALQLHGGYGYTLEHDVQRIWRDVRLYRIGGGTDEMLREVISREMGLRPSRTGSERDE
ncbi:acyl-CoA dehydrogenase family protein [Geochorda subterranea]|uniref:Acyl-CoA dehydrogenase family protein n=1 Tax=Geochorda subterranea TaxID=3109564 RepID=A0ABZ1BQK6_9FIRM|nr:acyl-CoA dehydrogenase family protein [Limnochorda sp. LNt]WRP15004.1 acyl-CoA dehydrogenase family protein [Limnochorda sp. LNt]